MLPCAVLLCLLANANEAADEALQRAEAHARAGRWMEARVAYRKVAREFPGTEAGETAERRSQPSAFLGWGWVVEHGPSSNRVDVALLGDGYEIEHLRAFVKLAEDIPPLFERVEPFREYWSYFNFLRLDLLSAENGVDGFGREYDTALNARTAGTYAGHVAIDRARVHAMLAELPEHDALAICFVKNGVLGTGGGGIATIGGRSATTTVHEFGHAFGGLGDEYETEQSAHRGPTGRAPNVSDVEDPAQVPWAHWIAAKHPGIGVYEGAAGRVRGAWKPTSTGCVMSSEQRFCIVCTEALVLRIHALVDPIDACSPAPQPAGVREPYRLGDEGLDLTLTVMRPATHELEVSWWILPEERFPNTGGAARPPRTGQGSTGQGSTGTAGSDAPRTGPDRTGPDRTGPERDGAARAAPVRDRRRRGPLEPIPEKPWRLDRSDSDGVHVLRLSAQDLEPGRYLVVARAKDTTLLRGERWPLVLRDELGLLESERAWWIER